MAVLPFVVQPRRQPMKELIGTEESGQIEVERRGYLTAGEKAFFQQVQQFDDGTGEIITISRRVANSYGMALDKAYAIVMAIVSGNSKYKDCDEQIVDKIEQEFAEELTAVVRGLAISQTREELTMAATMLRYRVDNDFDLSDISAVHPDIIAALARLYREEEAKVLDAFETVRSTGEEKQPTVEEIEKKQRKGGRSPSKGITGSSSEGTQEIQSSD